MPIFPGGTEKYGTMVNYIGEKSYISLAISQQVAALYITLNVYVSRRNGGIRYDGELHQGDIIH